MNANLLLQGLELMAVGMGTVFVFLTLLVLATAGMSRLVFYWQGEPLSAEPTGGAEAEEIAAISAAVALHRQRHAGADS